MYLSHMGGLQLWSGKLLCCSFLRSCKNVLRTGWIQLNASSPRNRIHVPSGCGSWPGILTRQDSPHSFRIRIVLASCCNARSTRLRSFSSRSRQSSTDLGAGAPDAAAAAAGACVPCAVAELFVLFFFRSPRNSLSRRSRTCREDPVFANAAHECSSNAYVHTDGRTAPSRAPVARKAVYRFYPIYPFYRSYG